jgi:hypothetical protein
MSPLPKLICGFSGTLIPVAPYMLDGSLDWDEGSMFEGDSFPYSPDHGQFIEDLVDHGVEVYVLSGMGSTAVDVMEELYDFSPETMANISWLPTFSEAELHFSDNPIQTKHMTMLTILSEEHSKIVWIDADADNYEATENFLPLWTPPNTGLTLEDMFDILHFFEIEIEQD